MGSKHSKQKTVKIKEHLKKGQPFNGLESNLITLSIMQYVGRNDSIEFL